MLPRMALLTGPSLLGVRASVSDCFSARTQSMSSASRESGFCRSTLACSIGLMLDRNRAIADATLSTRSSCTETSGTESKGAPLAMWLRAALSTGLLPKLLSMSAFFDGGLSELFEGVPVYAALRTMPSGILPGSIFDGAESFRLGIADAPSPTSNLEETT